MRATLALWLLTILPGVAIYAVWNAPSDESALIPVAAEQAAPEATEQAAPAATEEIAHAATEGS